MIPSSSGQKLSRLLFGALVVLCLAANSVQGHRAFLSSLRADSDQLNKFRVVGRASVDQPVPADPILQTEASPSSSLKAIGNITTASTALIDPIITISSSHSAPPVTVTRRIMQPYFTPKQMQLIVKLLWYYFLLYFFTVVYNVANKKVLESFPMPFTVAASQVAMGVPLFLPFWAWRPPLPHLLSFLCGRSSSDHSDGLTPSLLAKIAACHGFGNVATVMALTSGSVSFVHVIKAAEPLFSAFLSVIFLNSKLSTWAYVSLIPIVIGVALASIREVSFSWWVFGTAMLSNLLYMSRMVFSKASIQGSSPSSPGPKQQHASLSAVTTFRLVTLSAALQLIPCAILLEGARASQLWHTLQSQRPPSEFYFVWTNLIMSGVSFYVYNEVAFWILDLVHPVTAAVGNSIKRIVLILASILVFHTPVSELGWIGSILAIGGSLVYALVQQWTPASVSSPTASKLSVEESNNKVDKLEP